MSINFTAPPTIAQFMLSDAFVRVIMGPVGSGKTTGVIMELLRRAIEQSKGPDGFRRTRWAIVRQTLSQIKMTILLDLLTWFRPIAEYKVSEQLVTLRFNDVVAEIYLIPLEEEDDQKRLLSMQLTGAVVNECIEINVDLFAAIAGRCGRYPSAAEGGPTWFGIIADTNAPVIGSEWWKMFEETKPTDWQLFTQPGGLEANAENIANLPPDYYVRLAKNPNKDWVRRYVHALYGEDPSGTAVFRESFRWSFHTVSPKTTNMGMDPVPGQVIIIGQDFGRSPCSVITQPDHSGRLRVLDEVIAEDIGLETHINRSLKPVLFSNRYAGMTFCAVGDPAGRAKGTMLEEDHFDVLQRLGIPAFPAPTNNIDARLGAVEAMLYQQRDGGPALVIDRDRCPTLVRAMNGAYRFGKTAQGITKPLPDKLHPWSDVADALQAVCLVVNSGLVHFIARKIRPRIAVDKRKPKFSARAWT